MPFTHATAVLLGDRGVLIKGDSGSGKSTLALALVGRFGLSGRFARLVADDQLFLSVRNGRLVASAPEPIAGMVEVYGLGPRATGYEANAVVDLVVRLVASSDAPRFQEDQRIAIEDCMLPLLDLPDRNIEASVEAIHAWLRVPPFL